MIGRSCAICVAIIVGEPAFEPLGRDDALVALCSKCTTEEIIPVDPRRASRGVARKEIRTDRADWLRSHRENLVAQGMCRNGANHEPRMPERSLCEACWTRQTNRDGKRPPRTDRKRAEA